MILKFRHLQINGRPSGVVAREASCCTKGPGKGMDVKLSILGPTNGLAVLRSKTGRQEVPGSISGCACRPSCSKFSVVFPEIPENTG